jgi:hypothetical protein
MWNDSLNPNFAISRSASRMVHLIASGLCLPADIRSEYTYGTQMDTPFLERNPATNYLE